MIKKNTILHISADYPAPAIYNLVKSSHRFNHLILSFKRVSIPQSKNIVIKDNLVEIRYFRLPFGLFINLSLLKLARDIEKTLRKANINFDVIHAHKLTVEGVIANYLAKKFNKPFFTTIRGMTDLYIIRHKPFSKFVYTNILANSSKLFFLAPWCKQTIKDKFSDIDIDKKSRSLPNIVGRREVAVSKKIVISNRFITGARLNAVNYKNKNLLRTIKAFDIASMNLDNIHLDIYLTGENPQQKDDLLKEISKLSCENRIHLCSPLPNDDFIKILPNYIAFLLPSFSETFGMVYFEAIFAGVPVLHSKETGIDGYFNNKQISCRVNHKSINEIADSILKLYNNQEMYKSNIYKCMKNGEFDFFTKGSIANNYQDTIAAAISSME